MKVWGRRGLGSRGRTETLVQEEEGRLQVRQGAVGERLALSLGASCLLTADCCTGAWR